MTAEATIPVTAETLAGRGNTSVRRIRIRLADARPGWDDPEILECGVHPGGPVEVSLTPQQQHGLEGPSGEPIRDVAASVQAHARGDTVAFALASNSRDCDYRAMAQFLIGEAVRLAGTVYATDLTRWFGRLHGLAEEAHHQDGGSSE